MNRYEILDRLGDGAYGEVLKARNLKTNEVVAIKKLKMLFPTWEECLQLRELKSLKVLRHDNIIQLKEVIRDKAELYFVFEYMETSLFTWMRKNNAKEPQVRAIMSQLFSGLAYMHKHGFFHRDIKPENCLCSSGIEVLKVADLGQAREIRSRPPFTDYVSTRWYRSPELLLRSTTYNSPIDLWACGCIMAELYLGKPLFAGSSEADQMCRICAILGTPTKETWPEGVTMVSQMQFKFPKCNPVPLKMAIPNASPAAIQLMVDLLQYDSTRRPTAAQALQYRFFMPVTARSGTTADAKPSAATLIAPCKEDKKGDSADVAQRKKTSATTLWGDKDVDNDYKCRVNQPTVTATGCLPLRKQQVSPNTRRKAHMDAPKRDPEDADDVDAGVNDAMLQDLLDEVMC
ncbi:CMGC/RCK/MAK protein kinase [Aphanomyces invadans]|uniref:CMGC/RCK/MAK protein kinase n=1 Tax=Aphanomyces invadans TaxID=157072 RepID=A0A024U6A8_9STRA|nr:CMGC/RCK/MAK protein kinase [Aphanomyces invadans]ETW01814.1 CMGC/RCK/MAK protein kinase [Aphanomyces invadans]RHY33396.1 hypothetical protein DYB32_001644 [Aphanomyces invadans]|eukprot:XP_008869662.1 CMGC/RCK/MAK protein kinase [Aphanomyces invadans]